MRVKIVTFVVTMTILLLAYLGGYPALYGKYPIGNVTFSYDETPIKLCISDFARLVNIKSVKYDTSIDEDATVTLRVKEMNIPDAILWISEITGLDFQCDGESLHVGKSMIGGTDVVQLKKGYWYGKYAAINAYVRKHFKCSLYF